MALNTVASRRNLKMSESGKRQSRWLENNLQDMDRSVKRMLKLIEEDADSLSKKVEMYFQKRPELVSLVDDFHRMYRSLAEKYDNVACELRKTSSLDLQSQTSSVSDLSVDLPYLIEQRVSRRSSGRRAAGFDVFLGSGGTDSDVYQREVDEISSVTDSGHESDDGSVNNYSGLTSNVVEYHARNRTVVDQEYELGDAKENLKMQQAGDVESFADLQAKIAAYEQELEDANRKIWLSEQEIKRLKSELGRDDSSSEEIIYSQEDDEIYQELSVTRRRLQDAESEAVCLKQQLEERKSVDLKLKSLQNQLELAQKEAATWKNKVNAAERREVAKLQDRISMLKSSLAIRDHEIRELKQGISDAEQKIFPEKAQIKAEISQLIEERARHEEQLKELESSVRSLEDDIRRITKEKTEMEETLNSEIENLKAETAEQGVLIENLNGSLNVLESEKDRLLTGVGSRDERIDQAGRYVLELEIMNTEMKSRMKEMEEEVEKQRRAIEEGAEEKREAIRQLCFSLEHYRDGYVELRRAFAGHLTKGVKV